MGSQCSFSRRGVEWGDSWGDSYLFAIHAVVGGLFPRRGGDRAPYS